ncbi:alpha-2-macroglobulin family protein [Methylomagnum sp.]
MLRTLLLLLFVIGQVFADEAKVPRTRVEAFSPQGTVKGVRQVTARFTEAMVALGDPRLPAPFEVDCPGKGAGRWADTRNWVYDFEQDLPAGLVCRFKLKPGLHSLAGRPLAGATDFAFDTGGPAIRASLPEEGATRIDERQAFVLALDAPANPESIRVHARCEITGLSEQVDVDILSGKEREDILAQRRELGYAYYGLLWKDGEELLARVKDDALQKAESLLVVLQCRRALPPDTEVRLIWEAGIRADSGVATVQDHVLNFKTRPNFTARLQCQRVNAQAACLPMLPMQLSFSAPVKAEDLMRVRIVDGAGKAYPADPIDAAKTPYADEVQLRGPFPEKARLKVELPADFRDDAGRPLENAARFPLPTATDEYPPLAKFSGDFGIIEREAGGILPVTLRNLESAVAGRRIVVEAQNGVPGQVKRLDQSDGEIAHWIERVREAGSLRGEWVEGGPDGKSIWREATGSESVFGADDKPEPITLPKPLGEKEFEVVGIPLEKSGFYVVELASPKLGASLLGENKPRYVATAALVSNLAVHFKWGREASVIWVTTLDQAGPVKGAVIRVSDYCSGKLLWEGQSGEDGVARIGAGVLGTPHSGSGCYSDTPAPLFISARTSDDLGFTVSSWNKGIQPTDFNLRTAEYVGPELAHTVLDRALFRAGETVSMKHFLRRHTLQGFGLPETFAPDAIEITHADSGQQYKLPVQFDGLGIAETTWAIPKDAKLGVYNIAMLDQKQSQRFESGMFHVEQFRLPTMKAVIQPPAEPLVNAHSAPLDLFVAYLSGGGAGNAPVKLRTLVEAKAVQFPKYPDYNFGGDPVREGVTQEADSPDEEATPTHKPGQVLALTLDAQGAQRATLTDLPVSPKPQDLIAELEYQDANGELEAVTQRIPLWPAKLNLGLRTEGWAASRDQLRFRVVALDLAGKPAAGRRVSVELFQRTYYSYRKRLIGGFYAYDNRSEVKRIDGACKGDTDEQGLLLCALAPEATGEILLQAKAKDDQGNETVTVTSAWVAGEEDWWFEGGSADRMDVLPEKKEYEPGDTARFQVRMPFREATALVSVEREGVAETFITRLSGKTPVIEVPIQAHHSPNVFVSVLAVRGRVGATQSWLADMARKLHLPWRMDGGTPTALADLGKPAYRLGNAEIKVGWNPHRLNVKVEPATSVHKVRDTAKVKLAVKRADGGPLPVGSEVALAAVDEALLELKPNASWQLLEKMMGVRPVEVFTSTAQMQVVGKRHYGRKAVPHGGGGGRQAARELFDTLLLWKGRLPLDAQGEAEVEIPLNDLLTSFRVVAVASGELGLFGTGSGTLRTSQDLILHSGLPPLVREGDRLRGNFTVRNASQRTLTFSTEAKIFTEAGTALPEFPPRNIELAPGGAQELGFELTVPVGAGKLSWEILAREANGVAEDRLRVKQDVIPVHPVRVFQATLEQLDKPLSLEVQEPADAVPGRGRVQVDLQARLGDATAGVADYMARYPYNCLEQQVSRAVALRDESRWRGVMDSLPAYLDRDGLLKYFPSDSLEGSDVLSAYVLAIAHESGWELPERARGRISEALKNFVAGRLLRDSALPTADLSIRKLAAINALARYGEATPELLGSITIEPNLWPTSAVLDWYDLLARLEGIPHRDERKTEAEQILRARLNFQGTTLGFSTERDDALWWLMLSGDVNAARMVLAAVKEPTWRADVPRLVRGAVGRQQMGRWNITTANAWGVLALEKFSAAFESVPVTGQTQATLAGTTRGFAWQADSRRGSLNFSWPEGPAPLSLRHAGTGKPWVTIQSKAALPLTEPLSSGFKLRRTMTPVEQKQPGIWTRGDTARVTLVLDAQSDMTWVVVDDPIPSGATVLGTGLGRDAQLLTRGEKREGSAWPAYEERRFDAFRAYYRFVPKGQWTVEYTVRLNNPGRFELPATRIEALYAPEMFGEYPNEAVEVRPAQ